jgi:hypothetical protein
MSRDHVLYVRLTADEHKLLEGLKQETDASMSAMVRRVLLDQAKNSKRKGG